MIKALISAIILSVFLVGCDSFIKNPPRFPEVPTILQQSCLPLELVPEDTTLLSEIIIIASTNYNMYHECAVKLEGWIGWYDAQKEIYENLR